MPGGTINQVKVMASTEACLKFRIIRKNCRCEFLHFLDNRGAVRQIRRAAALRLQVPLKNAQLKGGTMAWLRNRSGIAICLCPYPYRRTCAVATVSCPTSLVSDLIKPHSTATKPSPVDPVPLSRSLTWVSSLLAADRLGHTYRG